MAERGINVDHTTIMRWVNQYSPEMEKKVPLQKIRAFYKIIENLHNKAI